MFIFEEGESKGVKKLSFLLTSQMTPMKMDWYMGFKAKTYFFLAAQFNFRYTALPFLISSLNTLLTLSSINILRIKLFWKFLFSNFLKNLFFQLIHATNGFVIWRKLLRAECATFSVKNISQNGSSLTHIWFGPCK